MRRCRSIHSGFLFLVLGKQLTLISLCVRMSSDLYDKCTLYFYRKSRGFRFWAKMDFMKEERDFFQHAIFLFTFFFKLLCSQSQASIFLSTGMVSHHSKSSIREISVQAPAQRDHLEVPGAILANHRNLRPSNKAPKKRFRLPSS